MNIKRFPILYKYTQKGQVQQWQIIAEEDHFWTEEGIQGGIITRSKPTYCKPKNVGKANATDPVGQALNEAQAKWQKKVDGGYNEVLSTEKKFFEPMLAKDYKEVEVDWSNLKQRKFVQPKLDGLRAISQNNTLMSRNGKPYLACPHLYQDEVILDGELYSHVFNDDFNKIVSLCKKQKPTDEELKESEMYVQMWIYDFPSHVGPFSERYEALKKWRMKLPTAGAPEMIPPKMKFQLVPTHEVKSEKELQDWHAVFLGQGFEGTILRIDGYNYENKRSKSLLKYKDFVDEEFEIVGAEEGSGGRTGTIGFFILKHDKEDKTFKSNVKGDFKELRQIWQNHTKYIGTKATVKYFNRTPDDVPRFPYVIKLNRAEYE